MNNEEIKALLHDFARGKLNDEEQPIVRRAIENDQELGLELEQIRAYYNDLKGLPEIKAPDDFLVKVRNRIERKGLLVKLRDVVFFPLYLKLPVEIAGTVAVSLFIIIIFNPFSPKIHVNMQENTGFSNHQVAPESYNYNTNKNNEINAGTVESIDQKDKVGEKSAAKEDGKVALKSAGGPKRRSIKPAASFARSMPTVQTSSRASEQEDAGGLDANKSAEAPPEVITEDRVAGSVTSSDIGHAAQPATRVKKELEFAIGSSGRMDAQGSFGAIEDTKRLEAPASTPAPSNTMAGAPMAEQQQIEPLAAKKAAKLINEQITCTWVPRAQAAFVSQSIDDDREITMEATESKIALLGRSKSKMSLAAKDGAQVSYQSVISNKLKADNIAYLYTSVKHAEGSLKAINQGALQYQIKIPAKNFKQLEMELNKRGIISKSSPGEIDSNKYSSKELIEVILTIDLKK